jgi:hypothetical protein
MNIYCKEGTKVKFINQGGWKGETEQASKYLNTEDVYTVDYVDIGGCISYVTLKEIADKSFNTVMFEEVDKEIELDNYFEMEENEDITLKLNKAELEWLVDMMCSESNGSKESNSLNLKLDKLYDTFCR